MTGNPYDVLGVGPDATVEEIRRAYLQAARDSHPDRLVDAGPADRLRAEEQMRRVNAAWRSLSDPSRRALVDEMTGAAAARTTPMDPRIDDADDDGLDVADELDDAGAPLPGAARMATALGPILLLAAASMIGFGLLFVFPVVIAVGFATGAVAVALFLAAPLLAMSGARRND